MGKGDPRCRHQTVVLHEFGYGTGLPSRLSRGVLEDKRTYRRRTIEA